MGSHPSVHLSEFELDNCFGTCTLYMCVLLLYSRVGYEVYCHQSSLNMAIDNCFITDSLSSPSSPFLVHSQHPHSFDSLT